MNAVQLLTNDHRTVDKLFDRYQDASGAEKKKGIVEEIIRELSIHASIEEQILYPGIRGVLPEGDELAEEAIGEHKEVKELLADLDRMDPSDAGFDVKVRAVIDNVRHHAEEEEREMFPKLQSAVPKKRLDEMGRAMERAKKAAPTRPHPHAPARPPGNLVAGPMAAMVDRVRDAVSGRGSSSKKSTSRRKSSAKKSTAKKATARKSPAKKATTRKSSARKTTARSTASRKSSAKKSTARKKSTAKRTTGSRKKSATRKSPAKKSTAKRSSSKKTTSRKSPARKSSSSRKGTGRTSSRSRSS